MTRTVLIIDDEPNMRWVLGRALEQAGYSVHGATGGDEANHLLMREPIELVLLDLKLKGEDGLTVLRRLRERVPELVVIILTAYGTVPAAVEAMQLGAADFLRKPFDVEEVTFKIARALERRTMQQELARLSAQRRFPAFDALVGAAAIWQRVIAQAQQAALTNYHVLVVGERGSGRTTLARAMHGASSGHAAPLVELDLQLYPQRAQAAALFGKDGHGGAWVEAGGGSLLLRDIAEATTVHEALGERLGGATGIGPRLLLIEPQTETMPEAIKSHIPIHIYVPPLRARMGDVLLLARHFGGERPILPQAAEYLEQYDWPENVAELRGVIERAARLADDAPIDSTHLPVELRLAPERLSQSGIHLPQDGINLEQVEQELIRQALDRARGNKSKAAELLGLTRSTLLYRLEKYGIAAPERS